MSDITELSFCMHCHCHSTIAAAKLSYEEIRGNTTYKKGTGEGRYITTRFSVCP